MRQPNINVIEFQFEFICIQNFEERNTIFEMSRYGKELNHVEINCVRKGLQKGTVVREIIYPPTL